MFSSLSVTEQLQALQARVSLGILDLSDERAAVVRHLNQARIPVIAWQLLPRNEGYWYNIGNAPQAAAQYEAFCAWSDAKELQWDGVGVDIEPDIGELQQLLTRKLRLIQTLFKRGCSGKRLSQARAAYHTLVMQMRADGYRVFSYEFPFMVDEQKAGSSLLRRILGVTDVPADQRVLMLYTSFFRPYGTAVLWQYARDAGSVGIGLTGGGVELEGIAHHAPLSWEEFLRDLGLARRWCSDIHVFSLEGCARQGFLTRMGSLDWELPMEPPPRWSTAVALLRGGLQAALWITAHPYPILGLLICLLALTVIIF